MASGEESVSKEKATKAGKTLRKFIYDDEGDLGEASEALQVARDWRQAHAQPLALVTPGVRNWVGRESDQMVVAQRLKRMPQIIGKLNRFRSMRLPQMEDIGGCRAVLATPDEVSAVGAKIERKWDVRYANDYRDEGKAGTGYRALHYVVIRRRRMIEIQLRTNRQHEWAEAVERTASQLGFDLKDGKGPGDLIEYFRIASSLLWLRETRGTADAGLLDEYAESRERVSRFFT